MATNREICALFFKTKDQGVFLCQLCGASRKQQLGSGYSNLMSHLISTYPGFEETYHSSVATEPPPPRALALSPNRHSGGSNAGLFQEVKRDMQRCSTKVGSLIKTEMGELFGLMWDGWSHASVHYVAIYAVCNVGGKRPERLLSLSPLDDGSQDAEVYIEMFKCVLALLWSSGILENRSAVFSAPSSTHKRSVFVIAGRRHVISHNFASVILVMVGWQLLLQLTITSL
ncbi:hypothetical protein PR001_g21744 [Phytophthora rubi]|uniref:BED-type domain-containing protein n=1 Tax=Phytophthora rubi TaxID=129364 RepID=A0A6A3J720_9STRA|nr:hypothetical protein PR001_g21744 [Phytophthora rubi]